MAIHQRAWELRFGRALLQFWQTAAKRGVGHAGCPAARRQATLAQGDDFAASSPTSLESVCSHWQRVTVCQHENNHDLPCSPAADSVNIKILNAGAWSRSSEKVFVSLPTELEDLIPEVEDFYKKNHSGRKLHWHHLMSNGIVSGTHQCRTTFGSDLHTDLHSFIMFLCQWVKVRVHPAHRRATWKTIHTHTYGPFRVTASPSGDGRKVEYLEKTHADTCRSLTDDLSRAFLASRPRSAALLPVTL